MSSTAIATFTSKTIAFCSILFVILKAASNVKVVTELNNLDIKDKQQVAEYVAALPYESKLQFDAHVRRKTYNANK